MAKAAALTTAGALGLWAALDIPHAGGEDSTCVHTFKQVILSACPPAQSQRSRRDRRG